MIVLSAMAILLTACAKDTVATKDTVVPEKRIALKASRERGKAAGRSSIKPLDAAGRQTALFLRATFLAGAEAMGPAPLPMNTEEYDLIRDNGTTA